jgi:hypothetical protein
VLADRLPPHWPGIDHEVRFRNGEIPTCCPLYSMSRAELVVVKEWLEENLSKGLIRQSSSPYADPVLFAKTPEGGLLFCIDNREINSKTIKNWYPIPLIKETLTLAGMAGIYTKVDMRGAYNLVWIKEWDEHKLDFRTRYGLYTPTVRQFGTTHAPADFQGYLTNAIREALDDFATAYLDDLLIYTNSAEEHVGYVKWSMQQLLEAGVYLKPVKYELHKKIERYLGWIISTQGISMDEDKVDTVRNWSWEKKTHNRWVNDTFAVPQFQVFCNNYRRRIPNYSEKMESLIGFTKMDEPFVWEAEQQLDFEMMVTEIKTSPALPHFDHEREVIIETDASDYVSAGVLSEWDDEGVLHPVAYYSKKLSPAECNYDIYHEELIAMSKALEECRPECQVAAYHLQLITDHKNLEYFMRKKLLNLLGARWFTFLMRFEYEILYQPGKSNANADALRRRPVNLPERGDESWKNIEQVVLKPQNLPEFFGISANEILIQKSPLIWDLFPQAYKDDPLPSRIL